MLCENRGMVRMNDCKKKEFCDRITNSPDAEDEILDFIDTDAHRYLYGGGLQTAVCLGIFRDMEVGVEGILLPPGNGEAAAERLLGRTAP